MSYTIAAFYRFVEIEEPNALRDELTAMFGGKELCGTLLIAHEGVNGTLAGSEETVERLLEVLREKVGLRRDEIKFAAAAQRPFGKLKFKVKPEIITFRESRVDPNKAGTYVEPKDWNALISEPGVLLLDTRNAYETEVGTFEGATDPHIANFSAFATYVRDNLDPIDHPKVAMFCTGGIRCEKASAFMRQQGFQEVYHLRGGILKYLEETPQEASRWRGECFVFDQREAVGHADLKKAKSED